MSQMAVVVAAGIGMSMRVRVCVRVCVCEREDREVRREVASVRGFLKRDIRMLVAASSGAAQPRANESRALFLRHSVTTQPVRKSAGCDWPAQSWFAMVHTSTRVRATNWSWAGR